MCGDYLKLCANLQYANHLHLHQYALQNAKNTFVDEVE